MNVKKFTIGIFIMLWTVLCTAQKSSILNVDYRSLISRADLDWETPVLRSEAGTPLGNGRMGTLVWTTPTALRFQINRVDVFAMNSSTVSFPARHSDYGSGCGYVDIDFIDFGDDIFSGEEFNQHLSVYDAVTTVKGKGITARMLVWHEMDVMAVNIKDQRETPASIKVDLRMLRYVMQYLRGQNFKLAQEHTVRVQTRNHFADSRLDIRDGKIILTQEFREGEYYNASAVAIGITGRKSNAKYANESTVRLSTEPGKSNFTILISSASTFNKEEDVAELALKKLDHAKTIGFEGIVESNIEWWHEFWSKSFIHLESKDGTAEYIAKNYYYFLYLMASSSRGAYPPRYGGMIWSTTGDMRIWGSQQWWHNLSCYYDPLMQANHPELVDPVFNMYTGMYKSCKRAAEQQWGSKGIYIPETVWFDGLAELPDEIAEEMRELYLGLKPWTMVSDRFRRYASTGHGHSPRWNWKIRGRWIDGHWVYQDKDGAPWGHVVHLFSGGAKIAYLYWLRYEHTLDKGWLMEYAYPMLKGVAEFYRNYPNVKKDPDGKYHIYSVNNHESAWGVKDALEEIAAMRGIFPLAIRAAEILDTDVKLRGAWQEFVDNLAPFPTNYNPEAYVERIPNEDTIWAPGLKPVMNKWVSTRRGNNILAPAIHYDLCTVVTEDTDMLKIANASFNVIYPGGVSTNTPVHVLRRNPIAAANLGRADDLRYMIFNQMRSLEPEEGYIDWIGLGETGVLANRLTLREGPGAMGAQRLGRASLALQLALLQSSPSAPGKIPIINVFPSWPMEWDASFTLLARNAFVVSSSVKDAHIKFVELISRAGAECHLKNPWGSETVTIYHENGIKQDMQGPILIFPTQPEENILIVKKGINIDQLSIKVPQAK